MGAGPRGRLGNAQGLRDLRERIAQVVVQDDDRPLLRCQPAEGPFELVPGETERATSGSSEVSVGMTRMRATQRRWVGASA